MTTQFEYDNDAMIVKLGRELDQHYAAMLRGEIDRQATSRSIRKIIFDFTNVEFMDSSGIGVIMGRYRLMQSVGGTVSAFGANNRLQKLIEMSGIKRIVSFYTDRQSAIK